MTKPRRLNSWGDPFWEHVEAAQTKAAEGRWDDDPALSESYRKLLLMNEQQASPYENSDHPLAAYQGRRYLGVARY